MDLLYEGMDESDKPGHKAICVCLRHAVGATQQINDEPFGLAIRVTAGPVPRSSMSCSSLFYRHINMNDMPEHYAVNVVDVEIQPAKWTGRYRGIQNETRKKSRHLHTIARSDVLCDEVLWCSRKRLM